MNETQIQRRLIDSLRTTKHVLVPDAYLLGSLFSSDLIRITPQRLYVEYQIEMSLNSFLDDFRNTYKWHMTLDRVKHPGERVRLDRHTWLTLNHHDKRGFNQMPRPKQFYFVAPKGVIPIANIPAHCGLIEMTPTNTILFRPVFTKVAPRLKCPTRLTDNQMWNLMSTLSYLLNHRKDSTHANQQTEKLS